MRFSVLINNHNYGQFLGECVESVLAQTWPAHEIIVVDDGSTDGSVEFLRGKYGSHPSVRIIAQVNRGQIAAVARAIDEATGDICCLLDADDRYRPGYLAALNEVYTRRRFVDLVFCRFETFGRHDPESLNRIWLDPPGDYDYGYSALLTYFGNEDWIGNFTSTISLRSILARALGIGSLPSRFYMDNQIDYGVILGSSLLGGRKYYLHQTQVDYRRHDRNDSIATTTTADRHYIYGFHDMIRWNYYHDRCGIFPAKPLSSPTRSPATWKPTSASSPFTSRSAWRKSAAGIN
jgi:glycosyltransferase involved in cell wall biosynthesis